MTRVPLFLLSFVIAMYVPGLPAKAQSSITCGEHNTVLEALQPLTGHSTHSPIACSVTGDD